MLSRRVNSIPEISDLSYVFPQVVQNWIKLALVTNLQKQSRGMFCKNGVLKNSAKFTGKHLCQSLFFNKVADWVLQFYLKWYRCFTMNFAKFLRSPLLTEHLRWLLLNLGNTIFSLFNFINDDSVWAIINPNKCKYHL